uniref:WD repeat-containing protein 65 n=1 Tax=Lygus hesperus TaxID=30085 RepID=A0A0A9WEB1_LYGHE
MYRKTRTLRFTEQAAGGGGGGEVSSVNVLPSLGTVNNLPLSAYHNKSGNITGMNSESAYTSRALPSIVAFTLTPPPAEEYLTFLTSTKQLYTINLPNAVFIKANDRVFVPLAQPFHANAVTGVDCCAQRPLVVTAGRDKTIML